MSRLIDAEKLEEILRSRCAQSSDDYGNLAGAISGCLKIVQAQPTVSTPPNTPLTPDELREMGKDWVWIELLDPYYRMENGYYIKHEIEGPPRDSFQCGYPRIWVRDLPYSLYGDDWLAYRCRPEDGMA